MEADWSAEAGAEQPVIVLPWEGFIDLRAMPHSINSIAEAAANSALANSLLALNAETSPVETSKCDCWNLTAEEIDPYEFESSSRDARTGIACYIDVVVLSGREFRLFSAQEQWAQSIVVSLRKHLLQRARVDVVVRPASVREQDGFGLTVYISACGSTRSAAQITFESALKQATAITMKTAAKAGE